MVVLAGELLVRVKFDDHVHELVVVILNGQFAMANSEPSRRGGM